MTFGKENQSEYQTDGITGNHPGKLNNNIVSSVNKWSMFQYDAANTGSTSAGINLSDNIDLSWSHTFDENNITTPVADGTKLYLGVGTDANSNSGQVVALERETGEKSWETTTDHPIGSPGAIVDGTFYIGTHKLADDYHSPRYGKLYAFDASTGEELWQYEPQGGVTAQPSVVDDTVYFGTKGSNTTYLQGTAYAVSATNGDEKWENVLGWGTFSAPAVDQDHVYIESRAEDDPFYALNRSDGSTSWEFQTPDFKGNQTLSNGTVFITGWRNAYRVFAIDAESGDELWKIEPDSDVRADPVAHDGVLYFATSDGVVQAVSQTDGSAIWQDTVSGGVNSSLIVVNSTLYVPDDGTV